MESKAAEDEREGDASLWTVARHLHRSEGAAGFYKGFHWSAMQARRFRPRRRADDPPRRRGLTCAACGQSATEKSIYFFGYTYICRAWAAIAGSPPGTMGALLCGCAAEWAHLPISLPIDACTVSHPPVPLVWFLDSDVSQAPARARACSPFGAALTSGGLQVTIQTQSTGKAQNPAAIIARIVREKGVAGLYSGWAAYFVLCLKPAITYALFDTVPPSPRESPRAPSPAPRATLPRPMRMRQGPRGRGGWG